jgi:P27 family predicted phage terminase small subunit
MLLQEGDDSDASEAESDPARPAAPHLLGNAFAETATLRLASATSHSVVADRTEAASRETNKPESECKIETGRNASSGKRTRRTKAANLRQRELARTTTIQKTPDAGRTDARTKARSKSHQGDHRQSRERPLDADEPIPAPPVTNCRPELGAIAKAEWKRLAADLVKLRLLTPLDRAALATYCAAYELCSEAITAIETYGSMVKSPQGFPMQSPYLTIANRQAEIMLRVASEFGFTPASRSRTAAPLQRERDLFDENECRRLS